MWFYHLSATLYTVRFKSNLNFVSITKNVFFLLSVCNVICDENIELLEQCFGEVVAPWSSIA